MKNVRDWISDNPKTFAGICTALLIIAIAISQMVAYAILAIFAIIISLIFFVYFIYTLILSLVEEFLC